MSRIINIPGKCVTGNSNFLGGICQLENAKESVQDGVLCTPDNTMLCVHVTNTISNTQHSEGIYTVARQ